MQGPLRRLHTLLAPSLLRHVRPVSTTPAARGLEELLGPKPSEDGKIDHTAGMAGSGVGTAENKQSVDGNGLPLCVGIRLPLRQNMGALA